MSALVPYKRVEVAVEACRLAGRPLIVAGDGPDRARLESLAAGSATFLGSVTNEQIRDLYRGAHAVLLPGEEDFGIVPVEAQSCGTPVLAYGKGGALETVIEGRTGLLTSEPTAAAFADALARSEQIQWDRAALRSNAERFTEAQFQQRFSAIVDDAIARRMQAC